MTLNVNFPPFAGINVALEVFGRNSRCFEQGKPFEMRFSGTVISQSTYGAGCYEVCPSWSMQAVCDCNHVRNLPRLVYTMSDS